MTRVFHDGRLDSGGRLYGPWTGMDQKSHRLYCTIDDAPVVEDLDTIIDGAVPALADFVFWVTPPGGGNK